MMSPYAPRPLRVLLTWPEPNASILRRMLDTCRPSVDVTVIPAAELSGYLKVSDYYHVLCISPGDWRGLVPAVRKRFATRVNLLILGSKPATPADLADAFAGIYFPSALSPTEAGTILARLHEHLGQGWTLGQCVAESMKQIALVGNEACWPAAEESPQSYQPQNKGGIPTPGSGINIGQIHVDGGMFVNSSVIYQPGSGQSKVQQGSASEARADEQVDLSGLLEKLDRHFNESELSDICLRLKVDCESVEGETKRDTVRELILYLSRRGRLGELVDTCRELRPLVSW